MSAPTTPQRRASLPRHAAKLALLLAVALLACGLGCGLLGLWQGVAEAIEPTWTLQLWGLLTESKAGIELAIAPGSIVTLYREARPHIGKIAALQKGLVWKVDGQTLIEEGYGLGVPIIEVQGQAYNSRTATILFDPDSSAYHLRKVFIMDTIDTPTRLLRRKYQPAESIGEVVVDYVVWPDGRIDVQVDFTGLTVPWDRAYIMNEQGADYFQQYHDDSGLALAGDQVGIWQPTTASRACWLTAAAEAAAEFCVFTEPAADVTLLYGRERYWQWNWRGAYSLSWAGVDIELAAPRDVYRYRLELTAAPEPAR